MKKRAIARASLLMLALVLLLSSAACGNDPDDAPPDTAQPAGEGPASLLSDAGLRVVVASDLHYLAPELTDHGAYFWRVMENGDGKITEYCDEILDAFLAEVLAEQPDALILTGDLSFNGALESHRALAEKLRAVEDAGIPVLVLPGNHDVYRSNAAAFIGDGYEPRTSATPEDFLDIYRGYGFDEALSMDEESLSYAAGIGEGMRVLMLDADTLHDYCSLSAQTLDWVGTQLDAAEAAGERMLVCCHQDLYQHSSMFHVGYVLNCTEELQRILREHGVPLFLSGHMHIQHIMTEDGLTEICSSALTMGACQYGVLQFDGDAIRYETRPVDVSAWARSQGREDPAILDLASYAADAMARRTRTQTESQLQQLGYTTEQIRSMSEYACTLNNAYFAGDLRGLEALDPNGELMALWKQSGTFFGTYLETLQDEIGNDYTHWHN
ncbi:MAG: metallophosphoesterase [Oscillospiraceae bacterium]|nr:metallophosphoesterase [Oscillospiraceae bacterium]